MVMDMVINGNIITKQNIIYVSDFFFVDGLRRINVRTTEAEFSLDACDAYYFKNTTMEFALGQIKHQLLRWIEEQEEEQNGNS